MTCNMEGNEKFALDSAQNENLPLVSIFVIAYNQEKFIGLAIESALNQTYQNIEIIVGDDCSTDATWEMLCDYQKKFPTKVFPFRNERNLGITGNSNEVLKRCRGKYVAHMGGDDLFLPDKIAKQVAAMESDPNIVLCYHDIEVFDSETNQTIRFTNSGRGSNLTVSGFAHEVVKYVVSSGNSVMPAMSVMVRRDALPEGGYDTRVPYASDWLMWIEVLAGANQNARVVFLPEVLARYRRHESNITNRPEVYRADPLVTLAIAEAKVPWLAPYIRIAWARARYLRGVQEIRDGNRQEGRFLLIQSARLALVSVKLFYWLVVSFVPGIERLRKKL